ncbi:MAG: alanine racemase [Armatimonadetes bacterium]|nr:alanine racemase [Armatimonadota bacterium]
MKPHSRTWADIDLDAFAFNLSVMREMIGPHVLLALVCKADAYGHGLVPMARQAVKNGVDWLAVATVQEGVALRDAGVSNRILVMSPSLPGEAEQAIFYDLDVMVESRESIEAYNSAAGGMDRVARLHLKVDTGLHRFGCNPNIARELLEFGQSLKNVQMVGLSHHFVDSASDREKTQYQIDQFGALLTAGDDALLLHSANSAAVACLPATHHQLVRVGIFAYGVDPFNLTNKRLKSVMTWNARVLSIRDVKAGETVSYASTFRLERDSKLATLGVGYGDGYPRNLSSKGVVAINGHRAPVVGLVCMDQTLIDVTDIQNVQIGDVAELLGNQILVQELATLTNTNSHEILTRIMTRVMRRYVSQS